jgi:cellulose synthase/poly-beta-1,6-N-acetylglucosamine synthase-like glycosyltransferase
MTLQAAVYWAFVACFAYLLAVYAAIALMLVVSAAEGMRLARQSRHEDFETLVDSRFTIPVSVIAPLYNEEAVAVAAVRAMLAQQYPEFEVVVVNDGSSDATLDRLREAFDLEKLEVFYRRVLPTGDVRGLYRSRTDRRLLVVDKANGGKADALNTGVNLARYRYLCTVDGDTVLFRDALLRGMRLALRDPSRVLGVTSQVEISRHPEEGIESPAGEHRADTHAFTNFQRLDYLRAFLNNRLGWSRLDFMLCSVGAFAIWRRDVVVDAGGFSSAFTCEDIEFTFRIHERFRREGDPYRILSLGDTVGRTEGPDSPRRLVSQRARWQRVITETVWHYRRMFLNPRYGAVGLMGVPYYVLVEVLAPIFQAISVVAIPLAWWAGVFGGRELALFAVTVAFANGVLTTIALILHDRTARSYRLRDLVRLAALGPLDLFLYRPVLFWAQFKGLVDFLRGEKKWHKFARNRRETV